MKDFKKDFVPKLKSEEYIRPFCWAVGKLPNQLRSRSGNIHRNFCNSYNFYTISRLQIHEKHNGLFKCVQSQYSLQAVDEIATN